MPPKESSNPFGAGEGTACDQSSLMAHASASLFAQGAATNLDGSPAGPAELHREVAFHVLAGLAILWNMHRKGLAFETDPSGMCLNDGKNRRPRPPFRPMPSKSTSPQVIPHIWLVQLENKRCAQELKKLDFP